MTKHHPFVKPVKHISGIKYPVVTLYTSSTTKAYSSFIHDIANNLSDRELEGLIRGSDEEAAFKSAISRCFVESTHVLCMRHLKQNVNRHLEDIVGYPLKERQKIISKIFDKEGLADTKDEDTYNTCHAI